MQMATPEKLHVIMGLLQERYKAAHRMRERSDRFLVLALGWAVGGIWFLTVHGAPLSVLQRVALTAVVLAFGAMLYLLQAALNRGFTNNRNVMITLEKALGAYEPDTFIGGASLYPGDYARVKRPPRAGAWAHHFFITHIWTVVVSSALIALIWVGPCAARPLTRDAPSEVSLEPRVEQSVESNAVSNKKENEDGELP